jgi:hypothetical protein
MSDLQADFDSHRIEGYIPHADNARLSVPLISHVDGNLWQGGCRDGVRLPIDFRYVFSLYPWERYELGAHTVRTEVRMYDALDQGFEQVDQIAREVVDCVRHGKTLVHCQAGLNRSGLITARALMLMGRTAADAISLLRSSRCDLVLCNRAFEAHLLGLDEQAAA